MSKDKKTNFFGLTEKERDEVVNEAVDKANQEQSDIMEKARKDPRFKKYYRKAKFKIKLAVFLYKYFRITIKV